MEMFEAERGPQVEILIEASAGIEAVHEVVRTRWSLPAAALFGGLSDMP